MGRGIPKGTDFGSPDACECFRYAPDAGSADILKNRKSRKFLFLRENGFRKNDVFIVLKRQTAKTEMTARTTRRYHDFIKISFCDGICQSNSCFSRKHGFSFFCTADAFHHEIMFWLEVEGSYFKQKNYHPSSPWCCLINSVNSILRFLLPSKCRQAWMSSSKHRVQLLSHGTLSPRPHQKKTRS